MSGTGSIGPIRQRINVSILACRVLGQKHYKRTGGRRNRWEELNNGKDLTPVKVAAKRTSTAQALELQASKPPHRLTARTSSPVLSLLLPSSCGGLGVKVRQEGKLFPQRSCRDRERSRNPEWLGEVTGHAEVDHLNRARLVEKPVMMMMGMSALRDGPSRITGGRGSWHLQIRDEEVVGEHAEPIHRGAAIWHDVHLVLGERERLRQRIPHARLVVWQRTTRGRPAGAGIVRSWSGSRRLPWPLTFEPDVDVALPKTPLTSHPDRRDLAGLIRR